MNLCNDESGNIDDISVVVVEILSNELGEECKTSHLAGTTRSSSKNLGSVIEIHSDMITICSMIFCKSCRKTDHRDYCTLW